MSWGCRRGRHRWEICTGGQEGDWSSGLWSWPREHERTWSRRARRWICGSPPGCRHWRISSWRLCSDLCTYPHTVWRSPAPETTRSTHTHTHTFRLASTSLVAPHQQAECVTGGLSWLTAPYLEFLSALVAQRLQREIQVVVVCQRAQIKVILGVDASRNVDVELQELQEVPLHLIPGWKGWREDVRVRKEVKFKKKKIIYNLHNFPLTHSSQSTRTCRNL